MQFGHLAGDRRFDRNRVELELVPVGLWREKRELLTSLPLRDSGAFDDLFQFKQPCSGDQSLFGTPQPLQLFLRQALRNKGLIDEDVRFFLGDDQLGRFLRREKDPQRSHMFAAGDRRSDLDRRALGASQVEAGRRRLDDYLTAGWCRQPAGRSQHVLQALLGDYVCLQPVVA